MRISTIFLFLFYSICIHAKEWRTLKVFQKTTHKESLTSKDWLSSDRKQNTIIWQNANQYNLNNNLPEEYQNIKQRRDFYKWYAWQVKLQGQNVVWPSMAYYISRKLRLTKVFPLNLLVNKSTKSYASRGNEIVFNKSFVDLKKLFDSDKALTAKEVLEWDKTLLYKEQYIWLASIYKTINPKNLKQVEKIAKGRCLYKLVVPKEIRFTGAISNAEHRYNFAIEKLKVFCEEHY